MSNDSYTRRRGEMGMNYLINTKILSLNKQSLNPSLFTFQITKVPTSTPTIVLIPTIYIITSSFHVSFIISFFIELSIFSKQALKVKRAYAYDTSNVFPHE